MNIRLSIAARSGRPTNFEHAGPVIRIGRDPDCHLSLRGEAADKVSRQHARIDLSAGGATLTDVGSSNGTLLNDKPLKGPASLCVGDRIQMGFTEATLTVLELDLDAPPIGKTARMRPALLIGTVAAVALVAIAVAVFSPRKPKGPEEYVQVPTPEAPVTLPSKTNDPPAPVQPPVPKQQAADTGKQPIPPPSPSPQPSEDTEFLARGPVHEAYAQPIDYQPQPGPIVAMKPPDAIDELPPDQKPDGDDVQWLTGYWAWDDDSKDYLWVSGFWRDAPPEHHWVSGAWQEVEGGWMWSPGFWASDKTQEVNYVPYPPPLLDENVPPAAAAQANDVFSPGHWVWGEANWLWRPGIWLTLPSGWVWMPARYVWTPGGCIFVDGFWDRPLERRGLLFAPVRFRRALVDLTYSPKYVVRTDFLLGALFVGPARRHYHFGDYFTDAHVKRGFVAFVDYRPTKFSYDPIFNHYRLVFHGDPAWERNLRELYRARLAVEGSRPPHTFAAQEKIIADLADKKANVIKDVNFTREQSVTALTRLDKLREERVTRLSGLAPSAKVEPAHAINTQQLKKEDRAGERVQIRHDQHVAQVRSEHEAKMLEAATVHEKPTKPPQVAPLVLPKAPAARPAPAVKPPPPPVQPRQVVRPHEPPRPPPPPKPPKRPHK